MPNFKNLSPKNELLIARRAVEELGNAQLLDDLKWDPLTEKWVLQYSVEIDIPKPISKKTNWFVLIDDSYPFGGVDFYPAKQEGLPLTFPHQNFNGDGNDNVPWRNGKLCLETNVRLFRRLGLDQEPFDVESRLKWHFQRMMLWLNSANRGDLLQTGDPFELPQYPRRSLVNVSFSENAETFKGWEKIKNWFGFVDLYLLENQRNCIHVIPNTFYSMGKEVLCQNHWGKFVEENAKSKASGAWILLKDVPVLDPWQAPSTWEELIYVCKEQGVDIMKTMSKFAPRFRDGVIHFLLIGFPIPEIVGGENKQIYWVGIELPKFNTKGFKGFQDKEKGLWWKDTRTIFRQKTKIKWTSSENWDSSELTSRGKFSEAVTSSSVLLLGAGSIGSAVAELLVRSGQTNMTILDNDIFQAGNLVRHTLGLQDIKRSKVDALAERLNACSPHSNIKGINGSFPNVDEEKKNNLRKHNVVLDCTGENEVLIHMEKFEWAKPKIFISASIGYAAKRMYLFISSGVNFSSDIFFDMVAPWMEKEQEETKHVEFPREGIGCWHPVFPARADDIWLMVSTAIKHIEHAIKNPPKNPLLLVFEQQWEGESFKGTTLVDQEEYNEQVH